MLINYLKMRILYLLKHYVDKWKFCIQTKIMMNEIYVLNNILEKQSNEYDEIVKDLANRKVLIAEYALRCDKRNTS